MTATMPSTLLALLATTTHDQTTWRAASSRRDLQARLPNEPLLPVRSQLAQHHGLAVIRFHADATGATWETSSAQFVPTRSTTMFGPIRVRSDGGSLEALLRQTDGRPTRTDISLGEIKMGEGLQLCINWRAPAKASGGPTIYTDYLALLLWTTDAWDMSSASVLIESMNIREVDLRAVLH